MRQKSAYFKNFAKRLMASLQKNSQFAARSIQASPSPATATQNLALSMRQPYAEQIMRGTKIIEYRSIPTDIRGRIYIYASSTPGHYSLFQKMNAEPGDFPMRAIVGTVEIIDCKDTAKGYEWYLARPARLEKPVKADNAPQPIWFIPFKG
jgi:hypothetical protein